MTTPMCEDGGPLREWAPLAVLLQQIPAKVQNGIFTQDISFTCIDALTEFIVIGTNHGLIYWYNREKQDLQRLRCEVLELNFGSLPCKKIDQSISSIHLIRVNTSSFPLFAEYELQNHECASDLYCRLHGCGGQ